MSFGPGRTGGLSHPRGNGTGTTPEPIVHHPQGPTRRHPDQGGHTGQTKSLPQSLPGLGSSLFDPQTLHHLEGDKNPGSCEGPRTVGPCRLGYPVLCPFLPERTLLRSVPALSGRRTPTTTETYRGDPGPVETRTPLNTPPRPYIPNPHTPPTPDLLGHYLQRHVSFPDRSL